MSLYTDSSMISTITNHMLTFSVLSALVVGTVIAIRSRHMKLYLKSGSPYTSTDLYSNSDDDKLLVAVEEKIHRVLHKITRVAQQGDVASIRRSLPQGWEVGVNIDGVLYYIDHDNQKTTWDHPLVLQLANLSSANNQMSAPNSPPGTHDHMSNIDHVSTIAASIPKFQSSQSSQSSDDDEFDDDLPSGWERAKTAEGVPFFVNHISRRTSWCDPRTNRPSVPSTQAVYLLREYRQQLVWLYVQRVDRVMQDSTRLSSSPPQSTRKNPLSTCKPSYTPPQVNGSINGGWKSDGISRRGVSNTQIYSPFMSQSPSPMTSPTSPVDSFHHCNV